MACDAGGVGDGRKGEPLANSTRPPVPSSASRNVHSAFDVGLLSGKMMGRALSSAIACQGMALSERSTAPVAHTTICEGMVRNSATGKMLRTPGG